MKSKRVTIYKVKRITVDCAKNDPVDIRCGGPQYLGFDFYVDPKEEKDMIEFIKEMLIKYKRPLERIYSTDKEVQKKSLWNKKRIEECIKEYDVTP